MTCSHSFLLYLQHRKQELLWCDQNELNYWRIECNSRMSVLEGEVFRWRRIWTPVVVLLYQEKQMAVTMTTKKAIPTHTGNCFFFFMHWHDGSHLLLLIKQHMHWHGGAINSDILIRHKRSFMIINLLNIHRKIMRIGLMSGCSLDASTCFNTSGCPQSEMIIICMFRNLVKVWNSGLTHW